MSYFDWNSLPKEQIDALTSLKDEMYVESRPMRDRQVPAWRRNEAFWIGIQKAVYLSIARDITTVQDLHQIPGFEDVEEEDAERIINIYRAHGEAIIAALSASIPYTIFTPSDATNPQDISTAKAYRKIADLIETQQEATLKIVRALYYLYNHGVAFAYNVYHRDKKYGIIKRPQIDLRSMQIDISVCPNCDYNLSDQDTAYVDNLHASANALDGTDFGSIPSDLPTDIMSSGNMQGGQPSQMGGVQYVTCPSCTQVVTPVNQQQEVQIPWIHSTDDTPKGRSLIEIYGPLHVTVPHFVRNLDFAGYLRLDVDLDLALVKDIYEGFEFPQPGRTEVNRINERVAVNQLFYNNANIVTVSRVWFRPWQLNRIKDDNVVKELKTNFPSGCYCVFVNDKFAEACDESMDDCWTATQSAVSEYIHAEPMGNILVPIQIMTNDLVQLTMETVESGISINFADPAVLDFDSLKKTPANPGDFIPLKAAKSGQSIDSSFFSTKPATLSQEIPEFQQYLEEQGQFVLGSFPSIYGGSEQGGSKTLGEYQQSRQQALQRLSIPWKSIASFWMHTIHKACNMFRNNMITDEKFTKPVSTTGFVNVWIKQSELQGEIGDTLVQNSEQLPVTWEQRRALIMQFIQQAGANPQIQQMVFHPENIEMVQELLGMEDLYIPGNDDRNLQLRETFEMINNGQPIPINIFDNNSIHIDVIDAFLKSDMGQDLQNTNPQAYQLVMMHRQMHNQAVMQQQQQQMQQQMQMQHGPQAPPQPPQKPPLHLTVHGPKNSLSIHNKPPTPGEHIGAIAQQGQSNA